MAPTTCCAEGHTRQRWRTWPQEKKRTGRVTVALVIPFTANGSAMWGAQLSTGPSPVAMACT